MNHLAGIALSSTIAFTWAFLYRWLNAEETVINQSKSKVSQVLEKKIERQLVKEKIIICKIFFDKYLENSGMDLAADCAFWWRRSSVEEIKIQLVSMYKRHIHCYNFYTKYSEELELNIDEIKRKSLSCDNYMEFFNEDEIEWVLELAYWINYRGE